MSPCSKRRGVVNSVGSGCRQTAFDAEHSKASPPTGPAAQRERWWRVRAGWRGMEEGKSCGKGQKRLGSNAAGLGTGRDQRTPSSLSGIRTKIGLAVWRATHPIRERIVRDTVQSRAGPAQNVSKTERRREQHQSASRNICSPAPQISAALSRCNDHVSKTHPPRTRTIIAIRAAYGRMHRLVHERGATYSKKQLSQPDQQKTREKEGEVSTGGNDVQKERAIGVDYSS